MKILDKIRKSELRDKARGYGYESARTQGLRAHARRLHPAAQANAEALYAAWSQAVALDYSLSALNSAPALAYCAARDKARALALAGRI